MRSAFHFTRAATIIATIIVMVIVIVAIVVTIAFAIATRTTAKAVFSRNFGEQRPGLYFEVRILLP